MLCILSRARALGSLRINSQLVARCISVTSTQWAKRPVLEGPQPPKRPGTAYILFMKDNIGSQIGDDHVSKVKKVAEVWRSLSPEEKKPYNDQYQQLKQEYEIKHQEFLTAIGNEDAQSAYMEKLMDYRRKRREYLKHMRLQRMGLIKPRVISPRSMFIGGLLKEAPDAEARKIVMKTAHLKWTALTDQEREVFAKQAEEETVSRRVKYEMKLKEAQAKGLIPSLVKVVKEKPKKKKAAPKKARKATSKRSTKKKVTKRGASSKKSTAKKRVVKKSTAKRKKETSKQDSQTAKKSVTSGRQFSTYSNLEDEADIDDDPFISDEDSFTSDEDDSDLWNENEWKEE